MRHKLQFLLVWATVVLLGVLYAGSASAFDEAVIGKAEQASLTFRASLQKIESEITLPAVTDQRMVELRDALEDIRSRAVSQASTLVDPIKEMGEQVAKLGPPPTDGRAESAEISAQRKLLNDIFARLQGAKTQLELVAVEAEQQAGRASSIQRGQFFQKIFEPSRSIFNPYLWIDAAKGITIFVERLTSLIGNWWNDIPATASASGLTLLPIIIGLILFAWWLVSRVLRERYKVLSANENFPDNLYRLWRIIRVTLGTLLLMLLIIGVIYSYLGNAGFLTTRINLVLDGLAAIVLQTVVNSVLIFRIAAPKQPQWRIVNLDETAASRFTILATACAALSAASAAFSNLADGIYLPVAYSIGQAALATTVMLILLALVILNFRNQSSLFPRKGNQIMYFSWAEKLRLPLWTLIAFAGVSLLFGYIALANFLVFKVFETAIVVTLLFIIHHASDAAVKSSLDPASAVGKFIRTFTRMGERGIERAGLLFRTSVDLLLAMLGFPILFLLWTVTWVDFRSMLNRAFFGFDIGNVTVSPWSILLVALILFGGIALTKLFVQWLNRRILSQTRIDKGVQDSLRKGTTYAGYIVAGGLALTAAGLDFSNLALIAGALGVGIGFGLQSIVNNFVSGLILLAERPVRVGDWVAVAAGEGLVKKINVRATEIETFDGCSIIVPNSNLITDVVRNWTHSDTMGRFTVTVGVSYDSDIDAVKALLFQITKAHPNVLTYPEPVVTLQKFGTYSLEFEIKATVADVFYGVFVASDIRIAILKAFKEKNIIIPLPTTVSVNQ